jgi:hypothetical protein
MRQDASSLWITDRRLKHGRIYLGGQAPKISLNLVIKFSTPPKFRFTTPIFCRLHPLEIFPILRYVKKIKIRPWDQSIFLENKVAYKVIKTFLFDNCKTFYDLILIIVVDISRQTS